MEDKYLYLNQLLKGICECHSISDRIKVKWKNRQYQGSLHPFLLVQLLFFAFQVVSSQPQDGVIVTLADYQSLQAIKHEFIDFKGVLRSWNDSGYGACSGGWAGIKCAQGQVIAIQLPWKGLGGRISEKIGQLQSLRKLSLHNNVLSGAVPFSLGVLPNLRGVYLFNNRLSGSIPPSIGYCTLLQTLDVSNNLLTGSIPPSLANSTKLYRLNFSFNSLSGSLPVSFTHSRSLIFLALQNNNLSGSIPDSWSGTEKNIHRLQYLTLDHNLFSGHIPASIGNISSITQLDLSNNDITGEIPTSFANLPNLNSFNVSYNNLSGSVPSLLLNKFNSSSFVGNLQLCGYSNSTQCPSPSPSPSPSPYSLAIPPSGEHGRHHRRKLSTKDIILIAAGVLLIVLLVLCCLLLCCLIRKRTASKEKNGKSGLPSTGRGGDKAVPTAGAEVDSGGEAGGKLVHFDGPFLFTADDLLCATAEIMGKSTYGTAYKATLEDGHQVAVKRLREKITKSPREFETEVAALGKIRHPNLLALRAYYLGPKGEKLLVFDYMPNGSLASFLHARGPETTINWPTRMNIAMGVARGLCYLHSQANIIHGNLTSSNILLDEQTNPHVAHFGLSRLMTTATANTSVNATAGAQGYTAPELSKLKQANTKSDVYSLGVIILELLTGKSPSEAMNGGGDLPQWVASIVKEEWTNEVFDLELMKDASTTIGDELLNTLKLSLHCVDPSPAARPEVEQVLGQLEEIKLELVASSGEEGAGFSATNE